MVCSIFIDYSNHCHTIPRGALSACEQPDDTLKAACTRRRGDM